MNYIHGYDVTRSMSRARCGTLYCTVQVHFTHFDVVNPEAVRINHIPEPSVVSKLLETPKMTCPTTIFYIF